MKHKLLLLLFLLPLAGRCQQLTFSLGLDRQDLPTVVFKKDTTWIPTGETVLGNDTLTIHKINYRQLGKRMEADRSSAHPPVLQVVVSSSYGCGGNRFAMQYANELVRRYGDSVIIYYVIGDLEKERDSYAGASSFLSDSVKFFSASVPLKERDLEDDRSAADTLTKHLFPETAGDEIGTPKFLIYDAVRQQLVFHGYTGFQNNYPRDVVGYFMDATRKTARR